MIMRVSGFFSALDLRYGNIWGGGPYILPPMAGYHLQSQILNNFFS
jgi:hypothetical protein